MSSVVMPESRSVSALARVEALRLAKHPVFVVGFLANAYFLATMNHSTDYYNIAIIPAFFIGLFGMVATFRLTRGMERMEETLGSTPAGAQDRVRALCLACLLPAAVGAISFLAVLVNHGDVPTWAYGAWSQSDRTAIFFGEIVVACLGGPLLGIVAARWLRFPGAPVLLVVGILVLVLTGEGLADYAPQARWAELVRLVSPWTQFTTISGSQARVGSWLGSPWLWVGWTLALCALAALGALLKGAEQARRERLLKAGLAVALAGLALLVLAIVLGPDEATLHSPAGVIPLTHGSVEG